MFMFIGAETQLFIFTLCHQSFVGMCISVCMQTWITEKPFLSQLFPSFFGMCMGVCISAHLQHSCFDHKVFLLFPTGERVGRNNRNTLQCQHNIRNYEFILSFASRVCCRSILHLCRQVVYYNFEVLYLSISFKCYLYSTTYQREIRNFYSLWQL